MAGRQGAGRRSAEGRLSAEYQEVNVSRVRRFSSWVFGLLVAGPLLASAALPAAFGQNLDAGKSASQIFAEVCANCHRSPREFRSNPGASFLREHYTTGSEMASTMAAYLSAGVDPRGAPQPKRPQATPPAGTAATRDAPPADPSFRDPRRAQQPPDPRDAKESRDPKDARDPKASPQPAQTRVRPATARAEASKPDATAETKPVQPPAPTRPALEEFEE
jgi:cytochrome c553